MQVVKLKIIKIKYEIVKKKKKLSTKYQGERASWIIISKVHCS